MPHVPYSSGVNVRVTINVKIILVKIAANPKMKAINPVYVTLISDNSIILLSFYLRLLLQKIIDKNNHFSDYFKFNFFF